MPGGGVALLRATKALDALNLENDDQKIGVSVIKKALQTPARQNFQNSGEDGSVIVSKILENNKYSYGYNAQTLAYGDLSVEGAIDPTKVVRSALQGAASVAGLLVTTGDGGQAAEEGARASSDAGRWHGRNGLLSNCKSNSEAQANC